MLAERTDMNKPIWPETQASRHSPRLEE
jgi:hypothetical protein